MPEFIEHLNKDIESLKKLLSKSETTAVAGTVRAFLMSSINKEKEDHQEHHLMSQAKQLSFLLSLMLSTPEPSIFKDFSEPEWKKATALLNNIFSAYQLLFWPTDEDLVNQNEDWIKVRQFMMPIFLQYHNTSLLAGVEQIAERIKRYCTPFDTELEKEIGISATDALQIVFFIQSELEKQATALSNQFARADSARQRVLNEAKAEASNVRDVNTLIQQKMSAGAGADEFFTLFEKINSLGTISYELLKLKFPDTADAYWKAYTIARGEGPQIKYPTEKYIYDLKPLILTNPFIANCPYPNKLFESILNACEESLKSEKHKESFLSYRDKTLENEAETYLRSILGEAAYFFKSAFETQNSHLEHDIVIISGQLLLIVEAKASPPDEPFRDPEKAFTRIKRSFKSSSGIQHAFDQGVRVIRKLDNGEIVPLYNKKGEFLTELNPHTLTKRICICVTRDDYGHLATNLSLLLDKEPTDSYPWVVSALELYHVKQAWAFFRWGANEFYDFLSARIKCHGKLVGGDELEFLGAHLHHGSLNELMVPNADIVQLNPRYSDFFDDLYFHNTRGTPAPEIKVVKPVLMNMNESFKKDKPVFVSEDVRSTQKSRQKKLGRNEPCFCGSGKKYKRCHGL